MNLETLVTIVYTANITVIRAWILYYTLWEGG